jgi:hypothetical protein
MLDAKKFAFVRQEDRYGVVDRVPYLPLRLIHKESVLEVSGLLDTGSSVNVLPYDLGVQLGVIWENQTTEIVLSGNLALLKARGLVLSAKVSDFEIVRLAFAWTLSNEVPLILGRSNFFCEFDVCFYASQASFDIRQIGKSRK